MSHSRAESWEHSHEHRRRSHGSELPTGGWDIWNGRTEATNTFGGDLIEREGKYEYIDIDMIDWMWFFVGLLDCGRTEEKGFE
jgi:hypothetical protein